MFKVVDPSVNKTEADITIVVQGVYKYRSMPLVKVLFTDHAVAWDLVTRKPSMQQSIFQKYVEVIQAAGMKESGPIILATKQVCELLQDDITLYVHMHACSKTLLMHTDNLRSQTVSVHYTRNTVRF